MIVIGVSASFKLARVCGRFENKLKQPYSDTQVNIKT